MNLSGNSKLYPFDWLVIGYSTLMIAFILAAGRPLRGYAEELIFYCGTAAMALLIARYIDENRGRMYALVRLLYPLLLFSFFYRATGGTMHLVFDRFFDPELVAFEKAVFGVNPTLFIDRHLLNTWATELFSWCYFVYYFVLTVFLLALFFKRDYSVLKSSLTAICFTFFLSYILFFLYPIEGPRWHFADQYVHQVVSPVGRHLVNLVIDNAAVHGGCMPSSHFAVALVVLIYLFKYYRRAGWVLLPIVTGLAVGTVWGRFHYVSDLIVGGLIGLVSTLLVFRWIHQPTVTQQPLQPQEELAPENVP
ncbi:MAG: phosphatase PAP2 family protein [candidate division Zixibacteria bacterium]|nr:phosphatase PAP2 family protein [candidate division Zixibacteria bacterium]